MGKNTILFLALISVIALFIASAQASSLVGTSDDSAATLSESGTGLKKALTFTDESELTSIMCLEAKAGAGEAVSAMEALVEALGEIYAEISALGITLEAPDYAQKIQGLNDRIDNICNAGSLDEQEQKMNELENSITPLKYTIRTELQEKLNSVIEPELKKKGEELKLQAEERFRKEGEELGQQAEERLRKLAEEEAAQLKAQLEVSLKAQAEAEIRRRAENGEYGEEPDQASLQAEGEKIKTEMVAQEQKKAQAELQAKYEKLAEEERVAIQKKLEENATEQEKKFEEIREAFSNLEAKVNDLKKSKYAEKWQTYKEQAKKEKYAVIENLVNKQIEAAKQAIRDNAGEMETAQKEGKLSGFAYKSADDLIAGLEKSKSDLIAALVNTDDLSEARRSRDEFVKKWQNVKAILEASKIKAKDEILAKIEKDVKPNEIKARISRSKSHFESVVQNYLKRKQYCEANPKVKTPSKSNQVSICTFCRTMKEYETKAIFAQNAITQYELALKTIDELNGYKNNSAATVEEVLKYKDKFIANVRPLADLEKQYEPIYRDYETAMAQNQATCQSYIK